MPVLNTRIVICTLFACILCVLTEDGLAATPPPTKPCDIVYIISHLIIPHLHYEKPTTLEEGLEFINSKTKCIEERETTFTFVYRLSQQTLHRPVMLDAKNVTMLEAIKRLLGDLPVGIGFEPGKLVFTEVPGKK